MIFQMLLILQLCIEILIRQTDIRAIQLAKAALHAGARLLMERMGVDTPSRIRLAGAFGSHIDVKYAMVLGMIPDCALDRVSSAANAAGTGARIALLNRAARVDIERRVRTVEKVETAVRLLEDGELVIVYDAESESCNLVTTEQYSTAREELAPED